MGFYGVSVYHCIPLYWFCQNVNNEKQLPRFGFVRFCFGELRTIENNGVQLVFLWLHIWIYEYMNIYTYVYIPRSRSRLFYNPEPRTPKPEPEGPNPDPDWLWIPILLLVPAILGLGPIHLAPLHRISDPIRLKLAPMSHATPSMLFSVQVL